MLLTMVATTSEMWGQTKGEEVYSTCRFGASYNQNNSSYTSSFEVTNGDFNWTVTNGNNNNNGWTNSDGYGQVKFGRKNNESVGQITTNAAYSEAVTKVILTIDALTVNKINSIKLYSGTTANSITTLEGEFSKATGTQTVVIANPAQNKFYDIKFDCASGSSNGLITVSKVEYYHSTGGNPVVSTPTFTPNGGSFLDSQEITISCGTDGVTIYYTTDGSAPSTTSTIYDAPFTINATTTVKAYAVKENYDDSQVATATFTKATALTVAEAIAATPATGTSDYVYISGIVSAFYNTSIMGDGSNYRYYISDDGTTTNQLLVYKGNGLNNVAFANVNDLLVNDQVIIYGKLTTYNSTKEVAAGNYIYSLERPTVTVEAPTFSPAAGTYAEAQTVTMSCTTDGAAIHYTTDGTEPDSNSDVYTTGIQVSTTTTFKAKAIKGDNASAVITATYHICSAENPYTVAQASAYTPATGTSSNVYIHGIVSAFYNTSIVGDGNNYRYYISDDGTTTNQLIVYKGKGLNETTFTNANDLLVGDIVTIYGGLTTFSNAPEVASGNYLVAWERPTIPSISAEDVALTYDATSGTIYYEIENYIAGTMTASTEADWISDFKYDQADEIGEVGFTTTENDGAARQATVTLTYTYNTNQTVTKNVTVSQAAAPVPSITVTPATVNAPYTGETSTLALTYQDITITGTDDFGIQYYDANNEPLISDPDWLLVVVETGQTSGYVVSYTIDENTGDARAAYFKVFAMNGEEFVYSNLVTINQAAYVPPVQTENYELFSGDLVEGDYLIVYNGVAMNNTVDSDRLQYKDVTPENNVISTNDATIVWHIAPSATSGYWTIYSANANAYAASTGAKNKAQMLADGTDDKALWSVESTAQSETYDFVNKQNTTNEVNATLRCNGTYGFACYANSTGGALSLYKKAIPSITINPGPYNMNCDGGHAVLDVAYANMAQDPQLEVIFYESDGTTDATYNHDWIDAHIDNDGNLDGTIQLNTSNEARSAYFKIKGVGNNSELVYSDLVTINQAAYALSIVFETTELNIEVGGESDRKISFDYSGLGSDPSFEVRRYESDGTTPATYDWLTTTISGNKVKITVPANPGDARHAYFKVYGSGSIANTESNLVTINQAEYVAPTYTVTYNANGGTGTMTDLNSPYTANTQVTLLENTYTAPEGKIWDSWLVEDANQTPIEVNEGKFNMPASNVTVTAQWVDDPVVHTYEWVLTEIANLTSSDVFVIVGTRTDETYAGNYAMSNNNGNNNPPTASAVTIANNKLSAAPADNLKWNISGNATDGYTFYPNGSTTTWLYCTNDNNGVRVGTNNNKTFKIEDGYLKNDATSRFVGVYQNKDWRCYTSHTGTSNNIKDQTFSYFKRQEASTDPQLSANDVNIASDATEGEITYTLENAVPGGQLSAEITAGNEGNWLTLGNVGETTVSFTCEDNTEQTERTATVTLTYTYNETSISATAVVTQAALIIDYATMPFAFDGGRADIENVNGLTQEGLDSDYGSSPKLKFNTTGDWMVLKLNAKPVSIIYDIKGNTFSGGTFNVQVSTDGITYNNIKEYTSLSDVQTDTLINANDDVRYIKWIYTAKSSGNVALGNIQVYDVEFTIINENTTIPDLTIANGEAYVVNSGVVLELTGTVTNTNPANLIVRDGGQLIHTNPDGVNATLQKVVEAYTPANRSGDGWYMIATPVDNLPKTAVASTSDFDLFLYNEPNAMWYAHWDNPGFETLYRGKGYLYANAADVDLNYAGLMKATDAEFSVPLSYECDDPDMKGFNLVGNPFTRNLKLGDMQLGGATLTQFYVVNSEHTGLVPIDNIDYEIKPGEGFFVQATEKNQTLEFNPSTKGLEDIRFIKIVAGNENGYDNAYINIGCGNTLRKTNIANLTSVYVMDQGLDYAATRVEELAGNMPVHFAPSEDGFFTITVEAKNIENINFMHLIDNIENTAINLLAEPTYTFKAGTSDNEDRFTLVFDFNNYLDVNENNVNDSFVYQSGDELILNGEGTLQVFDMMGRFVMSKEISGSERISTSTFETGVYVLRFVGETVMTQKIVIE